MAIFFGLSVLTIVSGYLTFQSDCPRAEIFLVFSLWLGIENSRQCVALSTRLIPITNIGYDALLAITAIIKHYRIYVLLKM